MIRQHAAQRLLVVTVLLLGAAPTGCGPLEVGLERTPIATPGGAGPTVTALTQANADLARQVGQLTTPPPAGGGTSGPLGRLAYVQGGDIWVLPLPAGPHRRITFDGHNQEPHWAPSGQWLTFRRDDAVWVIRPDGTSGHPFPNESMAPGMEYAWSPVADRLAFAPYQQALYLAEADALTRAYPTDAEVARMLLFQPAAQSGVNAAVQNVAWSTDGEQLACVVHRDPAATPTPGPTYAGVWTMTAHAGSSAQERYTAPDSGLTLAGWAPDGQGLFIWRDVGESGQTDDGLPLLRVPLTGANAEPLTVTTLLHSDFWQRSPDGTVAFTVGRGRETWQNKRIVLLPSTHGELRALTDPATAAGAPRFAPDSRRLAYVAMPDQGAASSSKEALLQRHLWVRATDGTGSAQQLTNDPAYRDERPRWSSDGQMILIARLDSAGRASLWLVPTGGGPAHQVVQELTPAPDRFANGGHIEWDRLFAWWPGPSAAPAPPPASVPQLSTGTPP